MSKAASKAPSPLVKSVIHTAGLNAENTAIDNNFNMEQNPYMVSSSITAARS